MAIAVVKDGMAIPLIKLVRQWGHDDKIRVKAAKNPKTLRLDKLKEEDYPEYLRQRQKIRETHRRWYHAHKDDPGFREKIKQRNDARDPQYNRRRLK